MKPAPIAAYYRTFMEAALEVESAEKLRENAVALKIKSLDRGIQYGHVKDFWNFCLYVCRCLEKTGFLPKR